MAPIKSKTANVDLDRRSLAPEYMDNAASSGADLEKALEELEWINRLLGGRATALEALDKVAPPSGDWTLLDVGAGGADLPRAAVERARRRGQRLTVTAVDFNGAVCRWAQARIGADKAIRVVQADVEALPFAPQRFDVVYCGLFLHHFAQDRAAAVLKRLFGLCRRGLIVNDLHRHWLAYYFARWVIGGLARSPMVRHDAAVSVRRGFRRDELEALGREGGLGTMEVRWKWAFRYMATAVR